MADPNTTSVAEDNVLHSIASKTPKEHKIGEDLQCKIERQNVLTHKPNKKAANQIDELFFCEWTVILGEDERLAAN